MNHFFRVCRQWGLRIALVAMVMAPSAAFAQEHNVEEGRTRFTKGIELYKEGSYHAALAEFRAAYAAAPSFRIHYNLGQTLFQLQEYAGAMAALEQYLAEGGDKIEAERRAEVEADLTTLRARIARVTLIVNAPDAEVLIDDQPRGKIGQEALVVSAGRRRVSVTSSGYQTETRVFDFAGAQEVELTFELKPIAAPTTSLVVRRPKSRTPFYIGLAATGALAGGTVALAIVTSNNHARYESALGVPDNKSAIDDAGSATRTTALVGDILGGATIVAAGLTVVAFVLTSGDKPARTGHAQVQPTVRAAFGPTSAGLMGTF